MTPAGVGHKRLLQQPDFLVVGGYPPGQDGTFTTQGEVDLETAVRLTAAVPAPTDPVGRRRAARDLAMRVAGGIALLAALCAFALGAARADQVDMSAYYDPGPSGFAFKVYCSDAVVADAQTTNTLTLSMWNGSELISLDTHVGVECDVWYDAGRENANFFPEIFGDYHGLPMKTTNHRPTHFVLEIDGGDAFFADWIDMYQYTGYDQYGGGGGPTRKIGQWGAPGGRGFCLSRDPNDHSGEWAAASDACDAAIRIDIAANAVYTGQPSNLAEWTVLVDCVHSGLTRTETDAPITFTAYDASGGVLASQTYQHPVQTTTLPANMTVEELYDQEFRCAVDEGNWYGQFEFRGVNAFSADRVASVSLRMGDWGAWHDVGKLNSRYYIDQLFLRRNNVQYGRWGGNEGMGWCLNNYPETWAGAWAALSVGGCYKGIVFDIASASWWPQ